MPCGPLLLKVIVRESHIDTRATVRHIRAKISALKEYLPTINYNIIDFNVYVHQLIQSLNARGEDTKDLLPNLFEAYKVATDKDFVTYIKNKENDYDEGRDVDPYQLMQLAQNKYKTMVDEKTWAAPSKEEEKIIALEAKITKLTKSKKGKDGTNSNKGKKGKNKNKDKANNSGKQSNSGPNRPAWKLKAPPNNQKDKPKTVQGKQYWWCPNHKMWCLHKASECQGVGQNQGNSNSGGNTSHNNQGNRNTTNSSNNNANSGTNSRNRNINLISGNQTPTPSPHTTLRVSSALQSILEQDDEE